MQRVVGTEPEGVMDHVIRRFTRGVLAALMIAALGGLGAAAHAQNAVATAEKATAQVVREAAAAVEDGQPDAAQQMLGALSPNQQARYIDGVGSGTYWLGRAHAARGDSARALRTWQSGLTQLALAGRFDPRVNNAYVRMIIRMRRVRSYVQAASAYLQLFEQASTAPDTDAQRVVQKHVAQMGACAARTATRPVADARRSAEHGGAHVGAPQRRWSKARGVVAQPGPGARDRAQ